MSSRLRQLLRSAKRTPFGWRFVSNLEPTMGYLFGNADRLSPRDKQIVRDLNAYGIASISFDDLDTEIGFADLEAEVDQLVANSSSEIVKLKEADASIGKKTFNLEMLGSEIAFDPTSIFSRFALSRSFVNIANAYFKMKTRLRYYNVWYTAATASDARESQLWHFDREDRLILKVFVYLQDVDTGSGPFTYAPRTHKKGKLRSVSPDHFNEGGVQRTTDDQMANVLPREDWQICTGKKGTVIFADTRGFHKGGEARMSDRLMFTCMYTSPASESKELISFPENVDAGQMGRPQRSALGIV